MLFRSCRNGYSRTGTTHRRFLLLSLRIRTHFVSHKTPAFLFPLMIFEFACHDHMPVLPLRCIGGCRGRICAHRILPLAYRQWRRVTVHRYLGTVTFAALIENFASQKEGCSHLNHFLTQQNSKCSTAEQSVVSIFLFRCATV